MALYSYFQNFDILGRTSENVNISKKGADCSSYWVYRFPALIKRNIPNAALELDDERFCSVQNLKAVDTYYF